MSATGDAKKTKDAKARLRACMDEEMTHLRVGGWRGAAVRHVELIGMAGDLHGTVCTCCARRAA